MAVKELTKRAQLADLSFPGAYCFVIQQGGIKKVILACPVCGQIMACRHDVLQEEPLTLAPSVVGPNHMTSQVASPCGHHFWVTDGKALDV